MFNLIVLCGEDSWETSPIELNRSRLFEYTVDEISERYIELTDEVINELKTYPCLFATEQEVSSTKIGYIKKISRRRDEIKIYFEIIELFSSIEKGWLKELSNELDIVKNELRRTHWSIKDEDLFEILLKKSLISKENYIKHLNSYKLLDEPVNIKPSQGEVFNTSQVFIVHGHDSVTKMEVSDFVKELGLEPIILHLQASSGMTIIEKIEKYTNVGYALVLYTPCDIGTKRDSLIYKRRARQNVVFEHGYLLAKLKRERVAAIVKDELELPNDMSGLVYISYDENDNWKEELKIELKTLGYLG
ncbi:Nucleotide-binding protein, predicted, TIR [Arcobacter nitrofigilis DSM 7299]|uniref:Nucleotide-binding protein, predicted, TIR n=1 Tax=Arcobacter nitrofigilis (strain ATCC 33309 / DSM 7299 / CCUG 15893 / LMG 7604 / NCTC 12251 / CI) TaxID=572480 RepID=D5V4Y7_ARCNC|nr:nucleotide-binding protein [Arcobacter nitrofigilis]ADG91949.1 Nucleotide-binding protein, predicted, TIR [Arcobacter nitrofigilis DSM 7299]